MAQPIQSTSDTIIVDPAKIAIFEGGLNHFNNALENVCNNINSILDNPGFVNEQVTDNIEGIRNKLRHITDDWNELAKELKQHLSLSLETISATQSKIIQNTEI